MVSCTSARPSGGRPDVPAKMTSSILPPRRLLAPCSPMTQARASTTLDLPDPLGPTTHVMPGSRRKVVADAKDLKPRRVRLLRYTGRSLLAVDGTCRGRLDHPTVGAASKPKPAPARRTSVWAAQPHEAVEGLRRSQEVSGGRGEGDL